uniref:P60 n=1 Tax=Arracacha latent virus C TaxID=2057938 RepID=A0A3Q8EBG9_9CLOS|nr:hypothetical protein [Arracacha latent virus C]
MVNFNQSQNVTEFLQFFFKKLDVTEEKYLIHDYLKAHYRFENGQLYKFRGLRGMLSFDSSYSLTNGEIDIDDNDDVQLVKLGIIYLTRIRNDLVKKMVYKPANLFPNPDWRSAANNYKNFYGGDMNDYLLQNKELGCVYTEEDINNQYPDASDVRKLTLYRVCNSLNKFIDISELDQGVIKGFDIKTLPDAVSIGEAISDKILFTECVEVFRNYLAFNNTKAGKAKIDVNAKIFDAFFDSLVTKSDIAYLKTNPLVLAKFMHSFDKFTVNTSGFKDNLEAINKLTPDFNKFIKQVFLVDVFLDEDKLFFNLPKNSVTDLLGDINKAVSGVVREDSINFESSVNTLPSDIDSLVTSSILKFLKRKCTLTDNDIINGLLFILGRSTTNAKRLRMPIKVSFQIKGQKVEFKLNELNSDVSRAVDSKFKHFRGTNFIRQWANKRAAHAMNLFRLVNFEPGLFSYVPGVLPYMRFDFFKAIPLSSMSQDEVNSFRTLRMMTETKSTRSDESESECQQWIFRD